jgi:hypothetical protein
LKECVGDNIRSILPWDKTARKKKVSLLFTRERRRELFLLANTIQCLIHPTFQGIPDMDRGCRTRLQEGWVFGVLLLSDAKGPKI